MKYIKRIIIPLLLLTITATIIIVGAIIKKREDITLQGVITARQYRAASKIAGQIDSIYISEGEYITKGQLLYTLTTPELETKLTQAVAAESAAQALDKQTLAGARKQQIDAAYNLYQRATAGRELAEKSYNRILKLHQNGVATTQQLDEATANFEAMVATQSAAYAEYSLALSGATKEQKDAAAAQVQMAQGAVAEVETYIADSRVYAPISGEVSTIAYYNGEIVAAGFPVVTIIDTEHIWAEFNIKEDIMPQITLNSEFNAFIPALDSTITLRVEQIAPQADFAIWESTKANGGFDIRTFSVKMHPTKRSPRLRSGMSVIIELNSR